jgi:thioredoxin reductase (NADPH)
VSGDPVDDASPDVIVLGAGPAGLSTAMWCASLGLSALVVDPRREAGGQLRSIPYALENVPGIARIEGDALAAVLSAQATSLGATLLTGARARVDATSLRVLVDGRADALAPRAVVLATGVRRRRLGVPGEDALAGRGVAFNIGRSPERLRGLAVVVIGGGDDAAEHAHLAAPHARSVTLLYRGATLGARAPLRTAVEAHGNVTRRPRTRVDSFEGDEALTGVWAHGPHGSELLRADAVFVCIGPEPASEGFGVALDARGYVRVDRAGRTSRPGVFAVGDVCSPDAPTVANALGMGSAVAKAIRAVDDGAALAGAPTRPGASDRLGLRGITLPARIGVYPREKDRHQTLSFDLDFDVDAARAAPADALRDTIDYAAVTEVIAEVVGRQHYNLIETVAEVVAAAILGRFPTRRVRVRVTKSGVPLRRAAAVIEVERRRA